MEGLGKRQKREEHSEESNSDSEDQDPEASHEDEVLKKYYQSKRPRHDSDSDENGDLDQD